MNVGSEQKCHLLLPFAFLALSIARGQELPSGIQIFRGATHHDLLARMTLEEKVAQREARGKATVSSDSKDLFVDDKGAFLPDHADILLKNGWERCRVLAKTAVPAPWLNSPTPCSAG